MHPKTARWLTSTEGQHFLSRDLDPAALRDAELLRRELDADRAAAVLQQVGLRRKASAKFGDAAQTMFFTPDGLEQATRPDVAAWRAARFAAAGARRVVDLGCGLGSDALAMMQAGLSVRPVERDPVTAIFAEANLGSDVELADATTVDLARDDAVFCDPARRTARGRTWRVEDFTPPWPFVTGLLDDRLTCLKLGPGVPYGLLPPHAAATWVSHRGDVVEASVWTLGVPGSRSAVLLPAGVTFPQEPSSVAHGAVVDAETGRAEPASAIGNGTMLNAGDVILEPDGAIIRAGLVDHLADVVGAVRVHPAIAYLVLPPERLKTLDSLAASSSVAAFRVDEVLPYNEKAIGAWVREHHIGTLEIKKRGLDVDPAALRRRLRPSGSHHATLILTPSGGPTLAIACTRLGRDAPPPRD